MSTAISCRSKCFASQISMFHNGQSHHELSQIIDSSRVPMQERVQAFRIKKHLIGGIPENAQNKKDTQARIASGLDEVFARQTAAEIIGLQQAEFSAITGETFFPKSFSDLVHGLSDATQLSTLEPKCPWTAAMLWCYSSTAEMTDKSSTTRLSLIKTELLKRSGRGIGDIVELSKSQCFGQDLVIVNESGLEKFEGTLQDIRMLQNSINSPSKDLSEDFCFRLQAFLRLQTKLKWTIRDLDAAIFSMRLREIEFSGSDPPPSDSSSIFISSFILKEIASIMELSSLTGVDPASLLPLWGIMDAHGEKSFLRRKFFNHGLDKISKIVTPPIDCMPLTIDGKPALIRDEKILISMSLDWPVDKFLDLLEVVNLDEIGETLDMGKLSALYRHVLICKILGVRPSCCKQFFKLFYSQSKKPLDRPTVTVSAIKAWKSLFDTDWKITALEGVLRPAEAESSAGVQKVAIICQVYGLDIDELTYLANGKISSHSVPQQDLKTPTLYFLEKLQKYADFKQKCQSRSQGKSIIALLHWLSTAVDVDTQEIANEITTATGWDNIGLKEAMDIKYEGYASTQMVVLLRSIDELLDLETIMSIHQELSFESRVQSEPSMYDLFCFAQTRCGTSFEGDAKVLDDIRARLTLA